ncbi:hypothetical protein [Hankyongella ginsenosidimutans]|uniref:hypothetical protein n=1 Tax=Hankyongella ginsenosidimutans TaxID=1763828 RepID=UPI001CA32D67|nr:hypothetical protein [Hankyongella ginsenosidimutans]
MISTLSRQPALKAGLIALALPLASCASDGSVNKEAVGTATGAALGGLLGASIGGRGAGKAALVAGGVFLGGLLGNQIGKGLDKADRLEAERTAQDALEHAPSGVERTWQNPDSGNSGSIVAKPAYQENGLLPRVHPDRDHRRQVRAGIRHSVPPAGRHLENGRVVSA